MAVAPLAWLLCGDVAPAAQFNLHDAQRVAGAIVCGEISAVGIDRVNLQINDVIGGVRQCDCVGQAVSSRQHSFALR